MPNTGLSATGPGKNMMHYNIDVLAGVTFNMS